MTLFKLEVLLGDKTREDVLAIIMKYMDDSRRDTNNLPPGRLSETTIIHYGKDGRAHADKAVVFEGHSERDYAVVVHKPHLLALMEQLKRSGFDCDHHSVWVGKFKEESQEF